ncbi:MAG TPA: hypothetical protein VK806_02915, partial [Bacteroidia bacterium]|nr:hypothetical protein [Bacteroidia bacterium]
MKRGLLLFSILVLFAGSLLAQVGHTGLSNLPGCKAKWTTNPFDHKLFVENKGQFNNIIPSGDKVLFEAKLGSMNAYFTATGVVYQYMEMLNKDTSEGTDPEAAPRKMIQHFTQLNWEGSNANVTIDAQQEESYYYTYPAENITTIIANVFRKITYHNLYPGIDVEYIFPKNKEGIKYTLIVHPGADVGKVKLKYSGDAISSQLNKEGDVIVHSDNMTDFTDHAPVSYYERGQKLSVGYNLNGLEESFSIKGNYDKTRTIIIDPWQTNPNYSGGYNKAYDLDYDNNGNIFVYGAFNPFQLVKLNSAGTILWTFNATIISGATNQWYYGDMCVDKVTGASYLTEGFNNSTGARIMKITAAGTLNALFPGNTNLIEMWRAEYDMCDDKIVIGGGGISFPSYQACVVDTTLKTLTPVNVLGVPASNCCHDIPLLAIDPSGNSCYMASAQSITYPTIASNQILRMPLPSLSPTTYMIPDGYNFSECRSVGYVGFNNPSDQWTNAMNGMVASLNWLYLYNGDTIRRLNKATGASTKLLPLTGQPYMWGGIDVDFCENVFVGYVSAVNLYDSAMNLTGNLVLPDTVFDLHVDNKGSLYACGVGYVTSISIPSSISPKLIITKTASCGCAGTATASLSLCSAPVTTTSYLWSPGGQTNQTATNLCPGTYTVKVSPSCDVFYTDSITLTGSSINPTIVGNDTICQGQNTTITATGGASYSWSNGVTSSSITVAPLKDSVYKVVVSDTSGCRDTVKVPIIVNPKPSGTVSSPQSICKGDSVHLLATG